MVKLKKLIYVLAHYDHWKVDPRVIYILQAICRIVRVQLKVKNPFKLVDLYRLRIVDRKLSERGHPRIFVRAYKYILGEEIN